jgi:hypothetical protein
VSVGCWLESMHGCKECLFLTREHDIGLGAGFAKLLVRRWALPTPQPAPWIRPEAVAYPPGVRNNWLSGALDKGFKDQQVAIRVFAPTCNHPPFRSVLIYPSIVVLAKLSGRLRGGVSAPIRRLLRQRGPLHSHHPAPAPVSLDIWLSWGGSCGGR